MALKIRNCIDTNCKLERIERIISLRHMPLLKSLLTFLHPPPLHPPQQPAAGPAWHRICMADYASPDMLRLGPRDQIILAQRRNPIGRLTIPGSPLPIALDLAARE